MELLGSFASQTIPFVLVGFVAAIIGAILGNMRK